MSISTTNKVSDVLSAMSPAEIAELQTQLAFRDAPTRGANARSTFTVQESQFWNALNEAMLRCNVAMSAYPEAYIAKIGRAHFADVAKSMHDYVQYGSRIEPDRTHAYHIMVRCLECYIRLVIAESQKNTVPVTPKRLLEEGNIGKLPTAVNRCFPGYAQARMLHMIVPRQGSEGVISNA
jgi:hypothetical protein